jgi:hypothetical protein
MEARRDVKREMSTKLLVEGVVCGRNGDNGLDRDINSKYPQGELDYRQPQHPQGAQATEQVTLIALGEPLARPTTLTSHRRSSLNIAPGVASRRHVVSSTSSYTFSAYPTIRIPTDHSDNELRCTGRSKGEHSTVVHG